MPSPKQPPAPLPRVFTTTAEIDRTIAKLERRIQDIAKLATDRVHHDDARVGNVEHSIQDTIREEFGRGSTQYTRHCYFRIVEGPGVASGWEDEGVIYARHQAEFEAAIPDATTRIRGLIDQLREKREDLAEPEAGPRMALAGRSLNPAIGAAAQDLYRDGYYSNAVFEAGKVLIDLVKRKSDRADLDGSPLMQTVFSVNAPILAFNNLANQSDRDEQQGMMYLYSGAAMGVRNPLGHRVGVKEQPERALQYLEFLSLLADRLDETKKVK